MPEPGDTTTNESTIWPFFGRAHLAAKAPKRAGCHTLRHSSARKPVTASGRSKSIPAHENTHCEDRIIHVHALDRGLGARAGWAVFEASGRPARPSVIRTSPGVRYQDRSGRDRTQWSLRLPRDPGPVLRRRLLIKTPDPKKPPRSVLEISSCYEDETVRI
jgi:hypothetical protein